MSQFIDEASCISGFTTTNAYAGGTDRYMAPELFQDQPKTAATDIWALGCLVVQIFSDRIPYQHITRRHAIPPVIIRGELPVSNDNGDIDPPLWNCLSKCFNVDPSLRPGAHEVRRHLSDRGTMEKSFISPVTLRSDSNSDDPEPSTSSSPVLPTMAALMDMDPEQVPPELKKEGSDWFA
ncbi:p21 protein (Cdc42 Rac)-activated kinase, partial [Tulasnella sp. 418]